MAGRKSAYDTIIQPNLDKIEKWLYDDRMTVKEICKKLNTTQKTFYKYYNEKSELGDLVKERAESLNKEIEAEYINTAIFGKYVTEETLQYRYDEQGNEILVSKTVNKRYIKPDSAQGIFTMKNRCGWSDKQDINVNSQIELDPLTKSILERNKNV